MTGDGGPTAAPALNVGVLAKLGLLVLLFTLVAILAGLTGNFETTNRAGDPVTHYGWLSLVPALIAIVLAFATRQVLLALFLGIVSGGVVFAFGSGVPLWDWTNFHWLRLNFLESFILTEIGTRGYAIILVVYLWCLGGLIGLWGRTGGAMHFAAWMGRIMVRGPRTAKLFAWFVGLIFHQGGTISTLLAGTTVRPILDQNGVSKEESTYIVDSTASPVATIIPFNVFPFVVAGAVAGTIPFFTMADGTPDFDKAVRFFFLAIPFNFYAIFALLFTLLLSLNLLPAIGGMRRARERVAETGELVRPGSNPLSARELGDVRVEEGYRTSLVDFLLPIGFLLGIAMIPFFIQRALGNPTSIYIVEAFMAALLVGMVVAVLKGMSVRAAIDGVVDGARGVTLAAMVLALALSLKGVGDALGTGIYVADLLAGLNASFLPLLLLVAGMVIAFSTGTSFGTFAVLFPAAIPLADALLPGNELFLVVCFGAVISGSVFGDQASPISDTTILSSLAVGCDLMDHVTTQIPYAAIAAGIAAVLFVVTGLILF